MIRFHDWRSLSATLDGEPVEGHHLLARLTQWREGRAPRKLRVYATCAAPLVPVESPAQVVWEQWPGRAPRACALPPERTLGLVTLILPDDKIAALQRQAVDRGLSLAGLIESLLDQLEAQNPWDEHEPLKQATG